MRQPRLTGTAAVYDQVDKLINRFQYPDELGGGLGGGGGGGGAPTIVVAPADSSEFSKSKADFVCSGLLDQTVLQGAVDLLPAGGGRLLLTEGIFNISDTVALSEGVHLEGMGYGTNLFADGLGVSSTAMIEVANNGAVSNLSTSGGGINIDLVGSITNLHNVSLEGSNIGVRIGGDNATVADSYINIAGTAFIADSGTHSFIKVNNCTILGASGFVTTGTGTMEDIQVSNCDIGGGITGYAFDIQAERVSVVGCLIYSWGQAFRLQISSAGDSVTIADNDIVSCGAGIYVENVGHGLDIHDNLLDTISTFGIELSGCSRGQIHHNDLRAISGGAANTYDAIRIAGASDRNMVTSNTLEASADTRYGINVGGTGECNMVVGNDLGDPDDYGTDALVDTASNTQLFWPNDATYGDNFTDCGSGS